MALVIIQQKALTGQLAIHHLPDGDVAVRSVEGVDDPSWHPMSPPADPGPKATDNEKEEFAQATRIYAMWPKEAPKRNVIKTTVRKLTAQDAVDAASHDDWAETKANGWNVVFAGELVVPSFPIECLRWDPKATSLVVDLESARSVRLADLDAQAAPLLANYQQAYQIQDAKQISAELANPPDAAAALVAKQAKVEIAAAMSALHNLDALVAQCTTVAQLSALTVTSLSVPAV